MISQTRWIALLVAAFFATMTFLWYLNRQEPIIAFDHELTIPYGEFRTNPFQVNEPSNLKIDVRTRSGIDFDVYCLSQEEYDYFAKVNSGELPRSKPITFIWESRGARKHRSSLIPCEPGTYVLRFENVSASNAEQLPLKISLKAEDHGAP